MSTTVFSKRSQLAVLLHTRSGGTAGIKPGKFDWKEFIDMSNLLINDRIPFRREIHVIWTIGKVLAVGNRYLCAAAQASIDTELRVEVTVSPHRLHHLFPKATFDLLKRV